VVSFLHGACLTHDPLAAVPPAAVYASALRSGTLRSGILLLEKGLLRRSQGPRPARPAMR